MLNVRWTKKWVISLASLASLIILLMIVTIVTAPEEVECPTEDEQRYINSVNIHLDAIAREARAGDELASAAQLNPSLSYDPEWVNSYLVQFNKIENLAVSLDGLDAPDSAASIRAPARQAAMYIKAGVQEVRASLNNPMLDISIGDTSADISQSIVETRSAISTFCDQ